MCQRVTSACVCRKSFSIKLITTYHNFFSKNYNTLNREFLNSRLNSNGLNNSITDSAKSLEMGNQASGPKKRPEITAGTLTRHGGNSGTSGLRLPIPNDEELEKRCRIYS